MTMAVWAPPKPWPVPCAWPGATMLVVCSGETPQLDRYAKAGFRPSQLSISCILVRESSDAVQGFNNTWACELDRHLGDNTQLSLDYAAWTNGIAIRGLRGTRHDNPYSTHDHVDHKKRRRPYWVPA